MNRRMMHEVEKGGGIVHSPSSADSALPVFNRRKLGDQHYFHF